MPDNAPAPADAAPKTTTTEATTSTSDAAEAATSPATGAPGGATSTSLLSQRDALRAKLAGAEEKPERSELDDLADGEGDLDGLLGGGSDDTLDTLEEPEATADAADAVPESDGEEGESQPGEDNEAAEKPEGRKRLNINRNRDGKPVYTAAEKAILSYSDEHGVSLREAATALYGDASLAAKMVFGEAKAPADAGDKAEPEAKTPDAVAVLAELKQERKDTLTQLADAKRAYDAEKEAELLIKLGELDEKLEDAREAARAETSRRDAEQATAATTWQQKEAESLDKMEAAYGAEHFADGSDFVEAVQARCAEIEAVNPGFFKMPNWPELVIPAVAAERGIARVEAKPVVKKAPPVTAGAKSRPMPAPGTAGQKMVPRETAADLVRQSNEAKARGDVATARALLRRAMQAA